MKKFFLAALAIAAIASCTKNEVVSVPEQSEITFQTVATKAAEPFDTDNKFISYAWFLQKDDDWANDNATSSAYISGAEIKYNSTLKAWKATDTYYWPKQGSLTFFAWTVTTTATPSLTGATVGCTNTEGITVTTAYDLTQNKNVDFMVADIKADQTDNTTTISPWKAGVPTVFRHALSKLEFKVVTVDNGGDPKDYSSEDVSFTLKSIALTGVNNNKTYAQGIDDIADHTWTEASPVVEIASLPVYTNATGLPVTNIEQKLTPSGDDYYIVLPQAMDVDDELVITYDITTDYTGSPVTETVSQSVKLSEIYPSDWEPTTNYVLTIKLGIKEIYWAPSVEPWTDAPSASTQF